MAGDLLWYPVEGNNTISAAPDVMVAFGRPKGDRRSYLQWLEHNIAPQVTFEVASPSNRISAMINKFKCYERYGVEEYYLWDPDRGDLNGRLRGSEGLAPIAQMDGWVSPRLKVRFQFVDGDLHLYGPDGGKFATYVELVQQRDQERQRAERLAAQLRAAGIEPGA